MLVRFVSVGDLSLASSLANLKVGCLLKQSAKGGRYEDLKGVLQHTTLGPPNQSSALPGRDLGAPKFELLRDTPCSEVI